MRILLMLACMALTVFAPRLAQAETHVEVLGTWPAGDSVTLGRNQNFYLHLRYTSDVPVHIWAYPKFQGKSVRAGTNTSRTYPAGTGEVLGWFFLFDPGTRVDEVVIAAGDGGTRSTPVITRYPVSVIGGDEPAPDVPQPAWLTSLSAADKAAQRADYEQSMNTPVSAGDILLVQAFMMAMAVVGMIGLFGPLWGLWRWRGGWRVAVAVPAALMAFVVLRLIIGVTLDPTSHNLWPFEILMVGGLSCAIFVALVVARKITGAARP